jgi:hypothetical protein
MRACFAVGSAGHAGNRLTTLGHRKPGRVKLNRQSQPWPVSILCQIATFVRFGAFDGHCNHQIHGEIAMAKGEQRSNREAKKPKKEKIKTIAAAPSQKSVGSLQPGVGATKRK